MATTGCDCVANRLVVTDYGTFKVCTICATENHMPRKADTRVRPFTETGVRCQCEHIRHVGLED